VSLPVARASLSDTIIQNGSTLDSTYVNVSGDTMTGNLTITPDSDDTDVLSVNQSDGTDVFDVDTTNRRIKVTSGTSGQSTIDAGLVVNNASGSDAINDFQVNSDTKVAIKVDASAETITLGILTTSKRLKYSATSDMGTDDEDLASKKYVDDQISYANLAVVTKTADYTADSEDTVILADATSGDITITLPSASTGLHYYIKKIDSSSNKVIVDGDGSETIDGSTTQDIISQYDTLEIVSDGTGWYIM